jgi:sugar phosphate isomerase/epimerase
VKPNETISIQVYSCRLIEPLEAQFDLLAAIGYRNVEPWGGLFADAPRLKTNLVKHGMKAPSAHVGLPALRKDAAGMAKTCRDLGVETIYAPAPPPDERDKDIAGWRALGKELAAIGNAVTGEGLKFGWHNHHWEFQQAKDGTIPMHVLLAEAPDMLWQVDLAWVIRGGADPAAWLKRHAGRIEACHVKDMAAPGQNADEDGWADVGHGVMDWKTLLPAMRNAGTRLFVLEHDRPSDAARFARRSMATLVNWN